MSEGKRVLWVVEYRRLRPFLGRPANSLWTGHESNVYQTRQDARLAAQGWHPAYQVRVVKYTPGEEGD